MMMMIVILSQEMIQLSIMTLIRTRMGVVHGEVEVYKQISVG